MLALAFRAAGHPNRSARGGAISVLGMEPKKTINRANRSYARTMKDENC
jgi:hypothetical protein